MARGGSERAAAARFAALGLLATTFAMLGASLAISGPLPGRLAISLWMAVTAALGAVIVQRAGSPLGWLLQAGVAVGAVGSVAEEVAAQAVAAEAVGAIDVAAAWVANWIRIPALGAFILLFLFFPTARLPGSRWWWVAGLAAGGIGLLSASAALRPGPMEGQPAIDNPLGIHGAGRLLEGVETAASTAIAIAALAALASLLARLRRSRGDERQQVKWLLAAAGLLVATVFFAGVAQGPLNELSFFALLCGLFALPVALTVALTKYRLYDIDVVINRTIVYAGLTTAVIVVYIVIVGVMGALVQQRVGLVPALIATGLVAVVFQPLRRTLQDAVDRVMFGERLDPYKAMTGLASRLEDTLAPGEVLPTIVDTVTRSLKLDYAAIVVERGGQAHVAASTGVPRESDLLTLRVVYQGRDVGRLVVAGRRGEALTPTDITLLTDLARSAAPAVHAVALTDALRQSRNDLLAAREEERRRLRRDLHDGLGPELAGIALGVGAARNIATEDPAAAVALLERLCAQAEEAARGVRGLVEGLRPPALDDLGLVETIRQKATAVVDAAGVQLRMTASGDLQALPAAVETAALRIALEAVTNVVRHAGAKRCEISLVADGAVVVEVRDDGQGIGEGRVGVGLTSMRERAEEVGGRVEVVTTAGGGTTVRAVLPL